MTAYGVEDRVDAQVGHPAAAVGERALDPVDRVLVVADVEQVETVFKRGVGYDSAKLFESAKGQVGLH